MTTAVAPLSPLAVLRGGLRLIARFVRVHPAAFGLAVTGAGLFAGAIVASAAVIGWIADTVIIPVLDGRRSYRDKLVPAAAAIVGVAVWKAAGIVLRRTAAGWLQFKTRQDVRSRLLRHELGLKLSWYARQSTGDLLAVADVDTDQGTGVLAPLPYASGVSLLLVGTVVLVSVIDPWLGLGTLVGLSVIVAVDVRGAWITYGMWEEVQHRRGIVSSIAHESFDGALTVKALGREDYETERLRRASDDLRDGLIRVNGTWASYQSLLRVLPPALIVSLLMVGTARIRAGAISAGDLVTVSYLLSLLAFPIQLIGFVLWDLSGSLAGWQRVQAVFDVADRVEYGTELARPGAGAAGVAGEAVGFGYEPGQAVLDDVELDVSAGTALAVVGPTGSGKSTLSLLLARLWDPESGRIHLDGRDLRNFALAEQPREVAYVPQQAFLFDDTVGGNITLGEPFTDDQVERAARLAGAHEFIGALPDGYDTRIGERGTTLSGGQQQRVALARALVRCPRLLILDDATSAVDPSVEAEILRRLKAADLPSTIILVAYRPASIRLADEVVFLDGRRLVAHGRHGELLAAVPGYARLVQAYEADAAERAAEAGRWT
ncbi:MAG: ABC transporter ATP-binding protein [Acidimicrobiia bacterium]